MSIVGYDPKMKNNVLFSFAVFLLALNISVIYFSFLSNIGLPDCKCLNYSGVQGYHTRLTIEVSLFFLSHRSLPWKP